MPTNVFDVTFPPDTQAANQLGLDIRNAKLDIQQRMALISGLLANRWNPGADTQPANWTGLLYFATDTQQIFQWNGAAWVQISFLSSLVASVSLTGQAAAIPFTTLYAVPASGAGMYRVSVHVVLRVQGTAGVIQPGISWTNEGGSNATSVGPGIPTTVAVGGETDLITPSGSATPFSTGIYLRSAASQNIQYRTVFSGVTGAPTYDFYSRLEYLGA